MFRWLRKIEDKARGGVCFVEFGDEHATEAAAVLQLRGAEIQAGDAFALVCRNVTAQVTVTLDGLDDVPAAPAEPGVHDLVMRRRRKALETVASAAAVVGEAAAVALTGSDADVLAASGTNSTVEAPAVIVGERPQIEPIAGMVASGPDSDVELDGANDPDLDRIPLPAAIPDAAADLAAHVAPVRSASDPWVKLDGVKLELFDGVQLWWQKFAGATAAENSARKAAQLIEEGAAPGRFSQITIAMRKGECPAD